MMGLVLGLSACASSPEPVADQAAVTQESASAATAGAVSAEAPLVASSVEMAASVDTASNGETVAEKIEPPKIVESCKKEPYVGFEKQARDSISKGWEATQADRFGVGFRDAAEYKKWTGTHKVLFAKVSEICQALTDCAKDNAKDKDTKCADLAQKFSRWQQAAEEFAGLIKVVQSTQPPELCDLTAALDDPNRCFHDRAEQLNKYCQSEECKSVSVCWQGISYLDEAIRQADQACKLVHLPLDKCRGYVEATMRRKADFAQCTKLHDALGLDLPPVL